MQELEIPIIRNAKKQKIKRLEKELEHLKMYEHGDKIYRSVGLSAVRLLNKAVVWVWVWCVFKNYLSTKTPQNVRFYVLPFIKEHRIF